MGKFNVYVLDEIEREMKKGNERIRELNNNPSRADYDEKVLEIKEDVNDAIVRIFYHKCM